VIVNAHDAGLSHSVSPEEKPMIAAIALRVRDAQFAYNQTLDLGAWAVPTQVAVMELNIPAVHGVGSSRIFFVDRLKDQQMPLRTVALRALKSAQWLGEDVMKRSVPLPNQIRLKRGLASH
jgi:4-hydroxyphenylpyruvate dioxygenase-like putative hemolysin